VTIGLASIALLARISLGQRRLERCPAARLSVLSPWLRHIELQETAVPQGARGTRVDRRLAAKVLLGLALAAMIRAPFS
jgi:hypothetical protein